MNCSACAIDIDLMCATYCKMCGTYFCPLHDEHPHGKESFRSDCEECQRIMHLNNYPEMVVKMREHDKAEHPEYQEI